MAFREWVVLAGQLMEGAGVGVMVLGAFLSVALLLLRQRRRARGVYRQLRQDLGRAILLGLEFLIAADIIRTVSEKPTLPGVAVLGIIVVIRTFLSVALSVELEGRWPWKRRLVLHRPPVSPPAESGLHAEH